MLDTLTPFHQQAEEVGTFLLEDRARDAERRRKEKEADGPSENID
ncbi:MAG TPA: hypothetical protein VEF89_23015 [Solirubrobacteraceae bacterium]|nr:hypothetical protein [Solirubrobacteraceae bacterium]